MDALDRFRLLRHGLYNDNRDFKRWFFQLQRCYPRPNWMLCELLGANLRQMWDWQTGKRRASPRTLLFIGYLIGYRIGAFETDRDLLRTRKLMATGELERMIDAFLAKEAKEAKRNQATKAVSKAVKRVVQPLDFEI